jgi:hypothetical protein
MITDAQARLSSAQALTTGTVVSTNSYDAGLARDIGRGQEIRVKVTVDTTFTGGTSLGVNIIESPNSDLSSPTVLLTGPVTVEASMTAGASLLDVVLPQTSKRYVGLQYVNTGTHTAGAVSAHLVFDTDSRTFFAANTGY